MKKAFLLLMATIIFAGCKKNDDDKAKLDVNTLELHYDERHQFKLTQGNKDVEDVKWSSSDKTVGVVGAGGFFTAKKIGETEVTANGISCKVSVVSYHNLCAEPYTIFGSSVATIKANEKRTVMVENSTGISFRGENSNLNGVIYLLEAGKSTSAALIFTNHESLVEKINTFFKERYTFLGKDDDDYLVFTDNKTLAVGYGYSEQLGLHAIYFPIPSNTKLSTVKSSLTSKIKESRQKLEKLGSSYITTQ